MTKMWQNVFELVESMHEGDFVLHFLGFIAKKVQGVNVLFFRSTCLYRGGLSVAEWAAKRKKVLVFDEKLGCVVRK